MNSTIKRFLLLFALLWTSSIALAKGDVLIFGGSAHDQFLGCLVCNEFGSKSICNGFSSYGNEFSSQGMFNEFAGFGNEFNSSSPWNEFSTSTSVPVLVDRDGNFYGYFTINDMRSDTVEFAGGLKKIYDLVDGDLEKVRKALCKSFGYSG